MPIHSCRKDGKPGYKVGNANKCWTYTPGDEKSRKKAKRAAIKQWYAMNPQEFKKEMSKSDLTELDLLDKVELNLETKK